MEKLKTSGFKSSAMTSQSSRNGKQDSYSTHVKHLTKSEIRSLQESKRNAYYEMMAMS
ncbi:Uncharacterised protein [Avibacterium paragallinarum]|uniref:Uncharacterized protein n=1 Tax=Avibacterium paragallinarum TaxID=728 RepID=A0A377I8C1_AVIPA|nr:Uncharacterised protein [Avibacterium paragallinarum]